MLVAWVVGWTLQGAWAAPPAPATLEAAPCSPAPPDGWVRLATLHPAVRVEARYAGSDNFTGAPLPGYHSPDLWLRADAADALRAAARGLAAEGLGLRVYDAYRPVRATQAMVAWTQRTGQPELVADGYIAARSGHNHGHTVDLTLTDATGAPLDMGGAFDHFGAVSHHDAPVAPAAARHRATLKAAMEAAGFRAYRKEWWHYRFPVDGTVPLDVPIGCPG